MNQKNFNLLAFNIILALIFGAVTSYIDLHSDEVQPAVLLLQLFSFILGYKHPQKAWLYSSILGLSIITGFLISKVVGFKPVGPAPDNIFSSLIALIPAFIGGYSGVIARSMFGKQCCPKQFLKIK